MDHEMIDTWMMSDLEYQVAMDMYEAGYDYRIHADVEEYWREKINTWIES